MTPPPISVVHMTAGDITRQITAATTGGE